MFDESILGDQLLKFFLGDEEVLLAVGFTRTWGSGCVFLLWLMRAETTAWKRTRDAEAELVWVICEQLIQQSGFAYTRWAIYN